ncbi:hypothetical protein FJU45_18490, partial [Acinetobacter baumannii]
TATGKGRVVHHTRLFLRRKSSDAGDNTRSAKTGWQCGQQAKDKLHIYCSQAHKMTFALI